MQSASLSWSDDLAMLEHWNIRRSDWWGLENLDVVSDPTGRFPKVLRVQYPAGSASPTATRNHGSPVGGVQFFAECALPASDQRYLRYHVRFSENFQFTRGGKLPGLCGGSVFSGGRIPDGRNGLSTRYMWREGGAGELYTYLPGSRSFGDSLARGAWHFTPGTWCCLEQHVTLNHPGAADGRIRVWVDGSEVLDADGLLFRTSAQLQIQAIFFSTFFGGSDPSWASPVRTAADFGGFAMSDTCPAGPAF